jgi:nucleosome binding factor SPN SPT16 subunit
MFCDSALYFLASKKKIDFLRQLEGGGVEGVPDIKLLVRDKADNDKKNFEKLVDAVKDSKKGETLGIITKDAKFPGAFMDSWRAYWSKNSGDVKTLDVMMGLTYIMAPKEEGELNIIKRAAQVTSDVFSKYLKEQIMDIIDNDKVKFNLTVKVCLGQLLNLLSSWLLNLNRLLKGRLHVR